VADRPETRYAKSGDLSIAYQVVGEGPLDVVLVPGWVSHVDWTWEFPPFARFLRRIASFSRLLLIDKRGVGASDRVAGMPTLEERMDDVRAVMDAVGSEKAALLAWFDASAMCALFAATFPERTSALVLGSPVAKWTAEPDFPFAPDATILRLGADVIEQGGWGQAIGVETHSPSAATDPEFVEWWKRYEVMSASPGAAAALLRMNADTDVRHVLPTISVPTLVLRRVNEPMISREAAEWIAGQIPGAKYVEVPGEDTIPYLGPWEPIVDEIEEFLTGARHAEEGDRVLATVVFTDIVGSTERAAELGDRRWRQLLDDHDALTRRQLERFRGREVKTTGDGLLATFDGPARAVRCAFAIRDAVRPLGVDVRAGVHTGEVELRGGDIGGIAVHIGQRVSAQAGPGEVLVSQTVVDLVAGSGLEFDGRGLHTLKGVPGERQLYAAVG
jgi:class 3 adenylate cyclase/pimeloyl-ACP methyl ester carboxylesterase